jgi:cytoskeletal protein CcmA (bactofilin family)
MLKTNEIKGTAMGKRLLQTSLIITVLAALPGLALAFSARGGDTVTLAKGETHRGTLYAGGQSLTIDGDVDGDVVCAGNTVSIAGTVRGDVLCAAQSITVSGRVEGNVRVAGQTVTISGRTARNLWVAAQTFTFEPAAQAGGELALLAQTATLGGSIGRELYGTSELLKLNGPVAGTVDVHTDKLTLGASSRVNGNLIYTSAGRADVKDEQVGGFIRRHEPAAEPTASPRDEALAWISDRLYWSVYFVPG